MGTSAVKPPPGAADRILCKARCPRRAPVRRKRRQARSLRSTRSLAYADFVSASVRQYRVTREVRGVYLFGTRQHRVAT